MGGFEYWSLDDALGTHFMIRGQLCLDVMSFLFEKVEMNLFVGP